MGAVYSKQNIQEKSEEANRPVVTTQAQTNNQHIQIKANDLKPEDVNAHAPISDLNQELKVANAYSAAHALIQDTNQELDNRPIPKLNDDNATTTEDLDISPWIEVLNGVADIELWTGERREDRPKWRHYLNKADELLKNERTVLPAEIVRRILHGDFDVPDVPRASNKVRVFVSSTFTDTKAERNQLMRDVYPYLRTLCRRLDIDFATVDMRWGVTDEATYDHSTVKMCTNEIHRCLRDSCGPAFLCFLSHKYGWRPLPSTIEQSEFETIIAFLINNETDTSTLESYYRLDKNSIEAEYVLKPMTKDTDRTKWWSEVEIMQKQLREACVECFPNMNDIIKKYFISVTEMEIEAGAVDNHKKDGQAFFVQRQLKDIETKIHQHRRLIDMLGENIDEFAQKQLQKLKDVKLPNSICKENMFGIDYVKPETKMCSEYIKSACEYVCQTLSDKILETYETNLHVANDKIVNEVTLHISLAIEKCSFFVGREAELENIADYLKNDVTQPLVIHGQSGSGKTALMAVAAQLAKKRNPVCVLILRFIGTTSESGSAKSLLASVCSQLLRIHSKEEIKIPTSYTELVKMFKYCIQLAGICKEKKTVMFLDSLDQLSAEDFGPRCGWFPFDQQLPGNVKIVFSTLPKESLKILKLQLDEKCFIEVKQLRTEEGPNILNKMLHNGGRKLSPNQNDLVVEGFKCCPFPLYLRLVADISLTWKSFDVVTATMIGNNLQGVINVLFERLETRYGRLFVHHTLAYITAAKSGLAQTELEDILSCDDDVLDSLFTFWKPPFRRIPQLLWARVRNDLGPYLVERGTCGLNVYSWYHRQFWETAEDRYLKTPFDNTTEPFAIKAHEAIADYFEGKHQNGKWYSDTRLSKSDSSTTVLEDRQIQKQPLIIGGDRQTGRHINTRKLTELGYHLLQLKDWTRFKLQVCGLEYIEAMFEVGLGYVCYRELTDAAKQSKHAVVMKIARFIGSYLSFLLQEPAAVYQLASQQTNDHPLYMELCTMKNDVPFPLLTNESGNETDDICEITLKGHLKGIGSCDYSSKDELIVSTGSDGTMRLWDVLTGAEVTTVTSLPLPLKPGAESDTDMLMHPANPCCFSRDGHVIAAGTEAGDVILWDTTGAQVAIEHTEHVQVTSIKFSPDDKLLVTSFTSGVLYIWKTDRLEHINSVQLGQHVSGFDFSPDGMELAVSFGSSVAMVDVSSATIKWIKAHTMIKIKKNYSSRRAPPTSVTKSVGSLCCTFHPSGKKVMTGGTDNHVAIWDKNGGTCEGKLGGHAAWIWSITFTKDGNSMFTASSDRTIFKWRLDDTKWTVCARIRGHSHRVTSLALDPNNQSRLVSGSIDCSLKVWDIANISTNKKYQVLKIKESEENMEDPEDDSDVLVNVIAFDQTSNMLAVSRGWSTQFTLQPIDTPSAHARKEVATGNEGFIKKMEFWGAEHETRMFVLDHGHRGEYTHRAAEHAIVCVYDVTSGEIIQHLDNAPTDFAIGKSFLVIGSLTGKVYLHDIYSLKVMKTLQWKQNITSVACSRVTDHVVATSGKECVVWRNGEDTSQLECPIHDTDIVLSAFSPDGVLVTGAESGRIYIWNIFDNIIHQQCTSAHTGPIKQINFSPTGSNFVTCADLSVRVWEIVIDDKTQISKAVMKCVYYGPVNSAVFKTDHSIIAGKATGDLKTLIF